jgi:hypothetical protein
MIYDEISDLWAEVLNRGGLEEAERCDCRVAITHAEREAAQESALLQPWLAVAETGIEFLYALFRFAVVTRSGTDYPTTFMYQVGRACSYAVSIRRLAMSGQSDPAYVLLRSLIENLDIALVAMVDDSFARRLDPDDSDPSKENDIWKAEIGYGRIRKSAAAIASAAGVDEPERDRRREQDIQLFSASTHSSFSSAFRSSAVVSLTSPGAIALNPLGHLSHDAPALLDRVTLEVFEFGFVVIRNLLGENPPRMFALGQFHSSPFFHSLAASFFVLQEARYKYETSIVGHAAKWDAIFSLEEE